MHKSENSFLWQCEEGVKKHKNFDKLMKIWFKCEENDALLKKNHLVEKMVWFSWKCQKFVLKYKTLNVMMKMLTKCEKSDVFTDILEYTRFHSKNIVFFKIIKNL